MTLAQTMVVAPDWIARQDPADWLTAAELAAWSRLPSPKRRADRLAGRLAAKRLLQASFGLAPHTCEIGSDGVAPLARGAAPSGINLSLSHSAGHGTASWAETATEGTVGVDMQQIRDVHPRLADRLLAADEWEEYGALRQGESDPAALLLLWTLKEAALKTARRRWTRALAEIRVSLGAPGEATVRLGEQTPIPASYRRAGDRWLARAVSPPTPPLSRVNSRT